MKSFFWVPCWGVYQMLSEEWRSVSGLKIITPQKLPNSHDALNYTNTSNLYCKYQNSCVVRSWTRRTGASARTVESNTWSGRFPGPVELRSQAFLALGVVQTHRVTSVEQMHLGSVVVTWFFFVHSIDCEHSFLSLYWSFSTRGRSTKGGQSPSRAITFPCAPLFCGLKLW